MDQDSIENLNAPSSPHCTHLSQHTYFLKFTDSLTESRYLRTLHSRTLDSFESRRKKLILCAVLAAILYGSHYILSFSIDSLGTEIIVAQLTLLLIAVLFLAPPTISALAVNLHSSVN